MAAVDTPWEDRIDWRTTPTGGEGTSRFGRYIHTYNEDGTVDVEFVGANGVHEIWERLTNAYDESVAHNKELLGITGGGSESGAVRRRQDAPVCPECNTTHNGECL